MSGYPAFYRRINDVLHIRGAAQWTAGVFTNAIATLPVGYRPANQQWLGAFSSNGNGAVQGMILLQTNGQIVIPAGYYSGTPTASGSGSAIPLPGAPVVLT